MNTELRTTALQTITLDGSALSPVTGRDKGHEVTAAWEWGQKVHGAARVVLELLFTGVVLLPGL